MTLNQLLAIAEFLGDEMTDEQSVRLMDEAKSSLSLVEINELYAQLKGGPLFTEASMYNGEMGGLNRY